MSERILVADDSLSVREAVEAALRRRGSRVDLACDGSQARSRLAEDAPALLITDVHMPGVDGYTLCREAKRDRPAMRVLLLVGTFEPFDATAASGARADGVLRKPVVAEELLRKIEELLGPPGAAEAEPARAPSERAPPDTGLAAAVPESAVTSREHPRAAPVEAAAEPSRPTLELSESDVERIARRVLELGGEAVLERVARELLAEAAIERGRAADRWSAVERSERGLDDRGEPERE